jgi:hypothetical protein
MTHHPHLMTHLQRAEDHVQCARQSWDATDITRCAECLEHLRRAAGEIQAAQQFAGEPALQVAGPVAKAKDRLQQLHASVNRLGRLVDSAIAFHRGLALQVGALPNRDREGAEAIEPTMSSEING